MIVVAHLCSGEACANLAESRWPFSFCQSRFKVDGFPLLKSLVIACFCESCITKLNVSPSFKIHHYTICTKRKAPRFIVGGPFPLFFAFYGSLLRLHPALQPDSRSHSRYLLTLSAARIPKRIIATTSAKIVQNTPNQNGFTYIFVNSF